MGIFASLPALVLRTLAAFLVRGLPCMLLRFLRSFTVPLLILHLSLFFLFSVGWFWSPVSLLFHFVVVCKVLIVLLRSFARVLVLPYSCFPMLRVTVVCKPFGALMLWMEEVLHDLEPPRYCNLQGMKCPKWCKISSIHRSIINPKPRRGLYVEPSTLLTLKP